MEATYRSDVGTKQIPEAASRRIILVGPSPPPYGGSAIQARLLERLLGSDGHLVDCFASNPGSLTPLKPLEKISFLRTIIRGLLIYMALWRRVRRAEVVHVLAASWMYFFLVVCPAVIYG